MLDKKSSPVKGVYKKPFIEKWTFKLLLSVIVALFLIISLIVINPFNEISNIIGVKDGNSIVGDLVYFFVIGWAITIISLFIARFVGRFMDWEQSVTRRFLVQMVIQSVSIILIAIVLIIVTEWLTVLEGEMSLEEWDWVGIRQILFLSIVLSLIVTTIYSGSHLVMKWRESTLEAARLKQISLESQLQSLKLQLDPHFVFNNFSTLSGLITENPATAQFFLDSLSQVHRYMLINLNKNIISLEEELSFIEDYVYLLKMRFGENLQIKITDVEKYYHRGIPPITVQILVENAVKHNVASRQSPLFIEIFGANDYLIVRNNIQLLYNKTISSKIGLKNIEDRYSLLMDKRPIIEENNTSFVVKVPLIDL